MLADQEKEAWWEHYIAVKLDLVENVLNDDVAPEDDVGCPMMTPSAADDVSTPMPGMPELSCFQATLISDLLCVPLQLAGPLRVKWKYPLFMRDIAHCSMHHGAFANVYHFIRDHIRFNMNPSHALQSLCQCAPLHQ